MKFTLEPGRSAHYIAAYRAGAVRIGQQEFAHSLIVAADELHEWAVTAIDELTFEHLAGALQMQPDIIVLGTGERLEFPPLKLQAALSARRVGLEVMDTAAACRTYNVLMSEDRRVVAALMITPAD